MSDIPPSGNPPPPPAGSPDPYNLGPSSTGMAPHVAAALSYVFGWITGLIFYLIERQNKFVRFHAMQSIAISLAFTAIYFVVFFLAIATLGLAAILAPLLALASLILLIIMIIQAAQGKWFKLPIIGDFAMKQSDPAP